MSRSPVAAILAVLLLASLAVPSAAEETPLPPSPADAVCQGFVGSGAARDKPRPNRVEVDAQYMAPEVEAWMDAQLAEGRTRFVSTAILANGSVLCAW
jgi:hypothetical protein